MLTTTTAAVLFICSILINFNSINGQFQGESFNLVGGQYACECSHVVPQQSKQKKRTTQFFAEPYPFFIHSAGSSDGSRRRQQQNQQPTFFSSQGSIITPEERFDSGFDRPKPQNNNINSITSFSLELLRNSENGPEKNLILSPLSAQFLLSLLEKGAASSTKNELQSVIGTKSSNDLNSILTVNSPGLRTALGIFHDDHINIRDSYKQKVEGLAKFQALDFSSPSAKGAINKWASKNTEDHIRNLIPDNYDLQSVKLVLASAIYFHNTWKFKFQPIGLKKFHTGEKQSIDLSFMEIVQNIPTYDTNCNGVNCTIINLPYEDEKYSMVLIVPSESTSLRTLVQRLTPGKLDDIFSSISETFPRFTRLQMPKFSLKTAKSLVEPLKKMQLTSIFGSQSDLSSITTTTNLFVSDILQQATLDVDENGTVATAATSALLIPLSAGAKPQPKTVVVNRPFISIILDQENRAPLFISEVNNPGL